MPDPWRLPPGTTIYDCTVQDDGTVRFDVYTVKGYNKELDMYFVQSCDPDRPRPFPVGREGVATTILGAAIIRRNHLRKVSNRMRDKLKVVDDELGIIDAAIRTLK